MTQPNKTTRCPECDGQFNAEETCADRYYACMALELTDPGYGAVHHFTVPAYMLQHPSHLSAEGWQAMRQVLHQFLVDGVSPAQMRRIIQQQQKTEPKSFNLVKGISTARPNWTWNQSILDVRLDDPETYCTDVRAWAEAVHYDIQKQS